MSDLHVSNNAAQAASFGAYLDGFPRNFLQGISFSCRSPLVWGHQWHSPSVQFLFTNLVVPDTISTVFQGLLPSLLLVAARHFVLVSAIHVPGRPNYITNALSFTSADVPYVAPFCLASPVITHLPSPCELSLNCFPGSVRLPSTTPIYLVTLSTPLLASTFRNVRGTPGLISNLSHCEELLVGRSPTTY